MPEHTPAPTPARSLYGFFLYLISKIAFAMYCIWVFVPDEYLHYFHIYYYPQKYWATAVPIQCLVALTIFAFFIYPSANIMLTPSIDSIHTISDPQTNYNVQVSNSYNKDPNNIKCICKDENRCFKHVYSATPKELQENTVPHLHDLNIRFVCKKLYLNSTK